MQSKHGRRTRRSWTQHTSGRACRSFARFETSRQAGKETSSDKHLRPEGGTRDAFFLCAASLGRSSCRCRRGPRRTWCPPKPWRRGGGDRRREPAGSSPHGSACGPSRLRRRPPRPGPKANQDVSNTCVFLGPGPHKQLALGFSLRSAWVFCLLTCPTGSLPAYLAA